MSNKGFIKESLLAKLPEGALRQLEVGGDEDRLYDGIAEVIEVGYTQMFNLGNTREPGETADIDVLEREYGFLLDPNLSEEDRRARIKALKYARPGSGTNEAMEDALHLAGFTSLVVEEGRQSQDPAVVVPTGGEYVVNGFEELQEIGYAIGCQQSASPFTYDFGCHRSAFPYVFDVGCLGLAAVKVAVQYTASDYWNLVFFVAGDITLDVNGYITSITPAVIDRKYRQIIREIILRLKPVHTWGCLVVDWSDPAGYGFGFFPMGISPHGL